MILKLEYSHSFGFWIYRLLFYLSPKVLILEYWVWRMCSFSVQCLLRVIIPKQKSCNHDTGPLLLCFDIISPILIPSHSPKSQQLFSLKVLILTHPNLLESISTMFLLRVGELCYGKAGWWSEHRAQLLYMLVTCFSPQSWPLWIACLFSFASILF